METEADGRMLIFTPPPPPGLAVARAVHQSIKDAQSLSVSQSVSQSVGRSVVPVI